MIIANNQELIGISQFYENYYISMNLQSYYE